jgi:adenine phosphoribosyltransferase
LGIHPRHGGLGKGATEEQMWEQNRHNSGSASQNEDEEFKKYIRDIQDWPKPGVTFRDITPLLRRGSILAKAIHRMAYRFQNEKIALIASVEARGFILGAALAHELECGFVPVRKEGKLPYERLTMDYKLEYGTGILEMHVDAIDEGQRVLIVDDVLATGGTAKTTADLVKACGGNVVCAAFLVELTGLGGRKLLDCPVYSLVQY